MNEQPTKRPTRGYTWFRRIEGNYDLCHPDRKEVQYRFLFREGAPKLTQSYVIPLEDDPNFSEDADALELARHLEKVYEGYIFSSCLKYIREVIPYLESTREQDERDYVAYKLANARYEVARWQKEAEKYERMSVEAL